MKLMVQMSLSILTSAVRPNSLAVMFMQFWKPPPIFSCCSGGSGLAAPADAGATNINVRSTTGFEVGERIDIDGETRSITGSGTAASAMTTLFIPVSTGPWLTFSAGSTNLPVTSATGFEIGQKIGIDIGGNYELATVTGVGKAATQTTF